MLEKKKKIKNEKIPKEEEEEEKHTACNFVLHHCLEKKGKKGEKKGRILLNLFRAQELCESRDGCLGLPSLISLMVSVDVKQHFSLEPFVFLIVFQHD